MAIYERTAEVHLGSGAAFDAEHSPGSVVPHSGIYRCRGCGREVAVNGGTPFPPQSHHQHRPDQGSIRWRMAVYAQGEGE